MEKHGEFGDHLLSVQAIVMVWDEKYAGWQPPEGGGVSNVTLYQRLRSVGEVGTSTDDGPGPSHAPAEISVPVLTYEYFIRGERMDDNQVPPPGALQVTLHCRVTKDIIYRQVMPTFHHWQIGEDKYGLVFNTPQEATRFHSRLQKAVEHLRQQSKSTSNGSNGEGGNDLEDDVFVPLELPLSRAESWESGVTSKSVPPDVTCSKSRTTPGKTLVPAVVHPPPMPSSATSKIKKLFASATGVPSLSGARAGRKAPSTVDVVPKASTASASPSPYPYVSFKKETSSTTLYMKPPKALHRPASAEGLQQPSTSHRSPSARQTTKLVTLARPKGTERQEFGSSVKMPLIHHLPPPRATPGRASPSVSSMLRRERCFYCKALYSQQENRRGACPRAPDPCAKWIRRGTCIWCAECLFVHCFNGDPVHEAEVCSCSSDVPRRTARWVILAALALFFPCLCLYPPLTACYGRCRRRGWAGARHRPSGSTQSSASAGRSSSAARMTTSEASSAYYR